MKIIIQQKTQRDVSKLINDIYTTHWKKIRRVRKAVCIIEVINGDEIKIITDNPRQMDGIMADVAIGTYAHCITRYSNQEKEIWDFQDLDDYLKGI